MCTNTAYNSFHPFFQVSNLFIFDLLQSLGLLNVVVVCCHLSAYISVKENPIKRIQKMDSSHEMYLRH